MLEPWTLMTTARLPEVMISCILFGLVTFLVSQILRIAQELFSQILQFIYGASSSTVHAHKLKRWPAAIL